MLALLALLVLVVFPALYILLRFLCYPRSTHIPFKNRHVLITGGSSGIGLELAKLAALEGAHVSILARDLVRLRDAQEAIAKATGQDVRILSADVKDFKSVQAALQEAGALDILICSHGVSTPKTFEDCSLDEMNHMIDTNLRGNMYVIKAALPYLKDRKDRNAPGSVAIFSSLAGQVGMYGYAVYSASKFSLRGMAEALQQELLPDNIRVSLIFPPDTFTPGYEKENESKPEITKLLSDSASAMNAIDVAKKSINGIMAGRFVISCNFDGWMLSIATAGMSPQPRPIDALVEIFLIGLMRLVAVCVIWKWYQTVINYFKHSRKVKTAS